MKYKRYQGKSTNSIGDYILGINFILSVCIFVLGLLYLLGGFLYDLAIKFVPSWVEAVVTWGHDVVTAFEEKDWKYTDTVLYGGILLLLILRYWNPIPDSPPVEKEKE